jgi:hypothetical protein
MLQIKTEGLDCALMNYLEINDSKFAIRNSKFKNSKF